MKILIVGAGPTGLTAAVELARKDIEVIVIDKKSKGATLSRAVGINPHSLKILEESGVSEQLLNAGIKYEHAYFHAGNQEWAKLMLTQAEPVQYDYNFMLGLPQDQTEEILMNKLYELGATIHYDTELQSFKQTDDKVLAKTTNGLEISADYMLGADGVRSTTRHLLGIECKGIKLTEEWSIADLDTNDFESLQNSVAIYALDKGQIVFIAPIGPKRYRLVANTDNAINSLPFKLNITKLHRAGKFNINIAQAKSYQQGRVFLAGDAAHCHSPVGGRGMNLGIADAADFVNKLLNNDLDNYTKSRYKEGAQIIKGSEVLSKIITSKNPFAHYLMLLAIKPLSKLANFYMVKNL